ncbi:MAG: hypothetical protein IJ600_05860, partial [Lachnospiraceae bacterium]|nr:hypothetical protein [Lachnospiraceae bacterium]
IHSRIAHLLRDYDPNIPSEMGFAHRRRRFSLAKPVTITARRAVNSNEQTEKRKYASGILLFGQGRSKRDQ